MREKHQGLCAGGIVDERDGTSGILHAAPEQAADSADTGLTKIVMTAEKRTDSAQRVPLAVTSISCGSLTAAYIAGADDLSRVVPDVQVDVADRRVIRAHWGTYQPDYSMSTASLTCSSPADCWYVTLFGKNLENKTIVSFGQLSTAYSEVSLTVKAF